MKHDLRYALRRLGQRPAFLITAVLTIGFGIGINITVFNLVNSLILRPLPIKNPERVFTLQRSRGPNVSFPNYLDIRDRNDVFSAVAAMRVVRMAVNTEGSAERYWGYLVTGNYFELLGIQPWRWRLIASTDDVKNRAHPAMRALRIQPLAALRHE